MKLAFAIKNSFSPANKYGATANIATLAEDIILILTGVAGAAAVILIVIAGIKFVTSGADPKKLASASSTLTYAIIGLAVTILAFVILQIVQFLIGSKVTVT